MLESVSARGSWLLAVLMLAACAREPGGTRTYGDPFSYCAAVGTADAPDGRYTGPAVPTAIAEGLRHAVGAPTTAPIEGFARGTSWRCMGGRVYACTVGANLPCGAKADTSRTPSSAIAEYCRQNANADFVPAYVSGRATVYEWRCAGGLAVIARQLTEPDARGFLSNIWHQVPR